ncbi:MAG: ABC transporter permease [Protaetiibacter sp.]
MRNLLDIGQQAAIVGVMAVGMTFVLIAGEIDLSIGAIYVLCATLCGELINTGAPWPLAALAAILLGALCGLVNGLITTLLKIPSFIVTLGTLSVFRGGALLVTQGVPINLDATSRNVYEFSLIGNSRLLGVIPSQFLLFAFLAVAFGLLLRFSVYGYHVYGVGGSRAAAALAGIPVKRVSIQSFVLSGAMSSVAGIVGLSYLLNVQGTSGVGYELLVITAVVVGGAVLTGGSGTMVGTVLGVLLIAALQNVLILSGVSSYWQTITTGVVIVASVALDGLLRRRGRRV